MAVQHYIIKLFDRPLAAFDYVCEGRNPAYACNLEIDPAAQHLLPMNLAAEATDDELGRFLNSRRIPKNRAYAEEILRPCGVSLDDTKGFIDLTKGASINDSYLVVAENDPVTFSECNLFENDFNVALQIAAYSGVVSRDALEAHGMPSELTASGQFPKAWRIVAGKRVLYKAGSTSMRTQRRLEPHSEYLACQVADAMGIPHVSYGLTTWRGELCSTCELMNTAATSFVPLYAAVPRREIARMGLDRALEFFFGISPADSTAFLTMLAFDVAIANKDRHFGNYGVLRDNLSGEVLGFAPIFDHNMALFCAEPDEAFTREGLTAAEHRYASAFGSDLFGQFDDVVEKTQAERLAALADFEFSLPGEFVAYARENPDAPDAFPASRLEALSAFVRFTATRKRSRRPR